MISYFGLKIPHPSDMFGFLHLQTFLDFFIISASHLRKNRTVTPRPVDKDDCMDRFELTALTWGSCRTQG